MLGLYALRRKWSSVMCMVSILHRCLSMNVVEWNVNREWWSGKLDCESKYGWLSCTTIVENYMQSCEMCKCECVKRNGKWMNFTSDDASVKLSKCLQHLNYSNLPNVSTTKKQARALPVVYREYKIHEEMNKWPQGLCKGNTHECIQMLNNSVACLNAIIIQSR